MQYAIANVKIEDDIAIPAKGMPKVQWPLKTMRVGQSFMYHKSMHKRVYAAMYGLKVTHPNLKFIFRHVGTKSYRVWRVDETSTAL